MSTIVVCLSLFASFFSATFAIANDGFYSGSGSTLVPVKNTSLRVIREMLIISPIDTTTCYEVMYQGKPFRQYAKEGLKITKDSFGTIGAEVPCKSIQVWTDSDYFVPHWKAQATYEVEALEDAPQVQMGFPIPTFSGEEGLPTPGVVNFRVMINGTPLTAPMTIKWLDGMAPDFGNLKVADSNVSVISFSTAKGRRALGYVWSQNFEKGKRYTLTTEYDFGEDVSVSCPIPGYLPTSIGCKSIMYYLTPLKLWGGPPPEEVTIMLKLPRSQPPTLVWAVVPRPSCIDTDALYYRFSNAVPKTDLTVLYVNPIVDKNFRDAETTESDLRNHVFTVADWDVIRKHLWPGNGPITCRLRESLKKKAAPELLPMLAKTPCVASCEKSKP